jgi:hypothetical protein
MPRKHPQVLGLDLNRSERAATRSSYARGPCREGKPFIRNATSRDKSVHEPIVRRPAHPGRLVGVLVIGRVAARRSLRARRLALSNLVSR